MTAVLMVSSFRSVLRLIEVILILVFVLALTYLTTRWMGSLQQTQTMKKNLKIQESIRVGPNKFIHIIQAGRKYLIVAIGKEEVHLLGELSEEELSEPFADKTGNLSKQDSFQEIMERMKQKIPKK